MNMGFSTFESTIKSISYLTDDVVHIIMSAPMTFEFKAGQFVTIGIVKKKLKRMKSYSILNQPNKKGVIEFCIKLVPDGFASEVFRKSKPGTKFEIKGPFGRFVFDASAKVSEHVFLSAGTGIAPFYSMVFEFVKNMPNKRFTLISGFRYEKNLLFHKEFQKLERNVKNFKYIPTLTKEKSWLGAKGRVQTHLGQQLQDKKFYICGLKDMVLETKKILMNNNVPKDLIDFERYN
jgi:Na+-transporting NADH:ubiquinone oxidoreductase subunit F